MVYTPEMGRQFWKEFDEHFKYRSRQNGLAEKYRQMGGAYNAPAKRWVETRAAGEYPAKFHEFVKSVRDPIEFVAKEQAAFFTRHFGGALDDMVLAFQDFSFGVLATPDDPFRKRAREPVHTMNGSAGASDYLSWHGFIEAVLALGVDDALWKNMRWMNGMTWELQVKARAQEVFPNKNRPLPQPVTQGIRDKWSRRQAEEIAIEFDNYEKRPNEWMLAPIA